MVVALSTFNAVEKSNFPIFQSLGAMASELHISKLLSDSSPSRLSSGRNRSPFAYEGQVPCTLSTFKMSGVAKSDEILMSSDASLYDGEEPTTSTTFPGYHHHQPVAEFLYQLTRMLVDGYSSVIEWKADFVSNKGKIVVHSPKRLQQNLLQKYFRHSKFSSFQRQLNYFGFRKLAGKAKMSPCSFVNDRTTSDLPSLLTIKRKTHGCSSRKHRFGNHAKGLTESLTLDDEFQCDFSDGLTEGVDFFSCHHLLNHAVGRGEACKQGTSIAATIEKDFQLKISSTSVGAPFQQEEPALPSWYRSDTVCAISSNQASLVSNNFASDGHSVVHPFGVTCRSGMYDSNNPTCHLQQNSAASWWNGVFPPTTTPIIPFEPKVFGDGVDVLNSCATCEAPPHHARSSDCIPVVEGPICKIKHIHATTFQPTCSPLEDWVLIPHSSWEVFNEDCSQELSRPYTLFEPTPIDEMTQQRPQGNTEIFYVDPFGAIG